MASDGGSKSGDEETVVVMSVRRMLLNGSTANGDGLAMSGGGGRPGSTDTPSSVRLSVGDGLLGDEWRDRVEVIFEVLSLVYDRRVEGKFDMVVVALIP